MYSHHTEFSSQFLSFPHFHFYPSPLILSFFPTPLILPSPHYFYPSSSLPLAIPFLTFSPSSSLLLLIPFFLSPLLPPPLPVPLSLFFPCFFISPFSLPFFLSHFLFSTPLFLVLFFFFTCFFISPFPFPFSLPLTPPFPLLSIPHSLFLSFFLCITVNLLCVTEVIITFQSIDESWAAMAKEVSSAWSQHGSVISGNKLARSLCVISTPTYISKEWHSFC